VWSFGSHAAHQHAGGCATDSPLPPRPATRFVGPWLSPRTPTRGFATHSTTSTASCDSGCGPLALTALQHAGVPLILPLPPCLTTRLVVSLLSPRAPTRAGVPRIPPSPTHPATRVVVPWLLPRTLTCGSATNSATATASCGAVCGLLYLTPHSKRQRWRRGRLRRKLRLRGTLRCQLWQRVAAQRQRWRRGRLRRKLRLRGKLRCTLW
jgi:hypothetical protein